MDTEPFYFLRVRGDEHYVFQQHVAVLNIEVGD